MTGSRVSLVAILGGLALAFCQWLIFIYAPEEQVMGLAQKIFYIHLPLAWWGLISFVIACACGIRYLMKRDLKYDMYGAAAVEIGMLCCTLTLITGSIWGRHSWGVWWTWDPRLTTALILWFIYAGCMALRAMPMPETRRASLCSVVAIAGVLDVPLVSFRPASGVPSILPSLPIRAAGSNRRWPLPSSLPCSASASSGPPCSYCVRASSFSEAGSTPCSSTA